MGNIVKSGGSEKFDLTIKYFDKGKPVEFDMITNISVDDISTVIEMWSSRRKATERTPQNLCDYIKSKGDYAELKPVDKKAGRLINNKKSKTNGKNL
jgi:hypothetical protein